MTKFKPNMIEYIFDELGVYDKITNEHFNLAIIGEWNGDHHERYYYHIGNPENLTEVERELKEQISSQIEISEEEINNQPTYVLSGGNNEFMNKINELLTREAKRESQVILKEKYQEIWDSWRTKEQVYNGAEGIFGDLCTNYPNKHVCVIFHTRTRKTGTQALISSFVLGDWERTEKMIARRREENEHDEDYRDDFYNIKTNAQSKISGALSDVWRGLLSDNTQEKIPMIRKAFDDAEYIDAYHRLDEMLNCLLAIKDKDVSREFKVECLKRLHKLLDFSYEQPYLRDFAEKYLEKVDKDHSCFDILGYDPGDASRFIYRARREIVYSTRRGDEFFKEVLTSTRVQDAVELRTRAKVLFPGVWNTTSDEFKKECASHIKAKLEEYLLDESLSDLTEIYEDTRDDSDLGFDFDRVVFFIEEFYDKYVESIVREREKTLAMIYLDSPDIPSKIVITETTNIKQPK